MANLKLLSPDAYFLGCSLFSMMEPEVRGAPMRAYTRSLSVSIPSLSACRRKDSVSWVTLYLPRNPERMSTKKSAT